MVSSVGGLNPRPLSHESSALTTKPQLLAKFFFLLIVIIQLMGSVMDWPQVISLSNIYRTTVDLYLYEV